MAVGTETLQGVWAKKSPSNLPKALLEVTCKQVASSEDAKHPEPPLKGDPCKISA